LPSQAELDVLGRVIPSDAAKRASDIINALITFTPWDELVHSYIAIRLSDGGYDGTLYATKRDAVRHQLHESQCAYVALRNLQAGAKPKEMELFLKFNRDAYDGGMRLTDPDDLRGGREVLMTSAQRDYYRNLGYK
jgi:hypothetical protein